MFVYVCTQAGLQRSKANISGLHRFSVCGQKDQRRQAVMSVCVSVRVSVCVCPQLCFLSHLCCPAADTLQSPLAFFHVVHILIGLTDNFNETLPLARRTAWI